MLVRANALCIVKGARRKAGSIFDYHGPMPHKYLDPVPDPDSPVPPDEVEETKQQMGGKCQKATKDMTIHELAQTIPQVI